MKKKLIFKSKFREYQRNNNLLRKKMSNNQSTDPILIGEHLMVRQNSLTRKSVIRPSKLFNKSSNIEGIPKKRITFSVDSKPAINFLKVPKMDAPLESRINNLMKVLGDSSPTKKGAFF